MSGLRRMLTRTCFALLVLLPVFLSSPLAAAQDPISPSNALRITPSISQIQLAPNQPSASLNMTVTNLTDSQLVVGLGARDFGAQGQTGSISFFGNGYNPATNPHGLQQSIQFNASQIVLPAEGSQVVPVTIAHTASLAAGGHYGAILFSPLPLGTVLHKTTRIGIRSSVAALLFVTTGSGGIQSVALHLPHISPFRLSLPATVYPVFSNTGNTQTTPRGQVTLYGPGSRLLSRTIINTASGLILPGSSRLFVVSLSSSHSAWTHPGIYTLQLQYRGSADSSFLTIDKQFFYVSPIYLLVACAVLALLVYGLLHTRRGLRRIVLLLKKH